MNIDPCVKRIGWGAVSILGFRMLFLGLTKTREALEKERERLEREIKRMREED